MALGEGLSEQFYENFASWVRIESRCRSNDLSHGIQARIADPLWMLARQWQVGEFNGEDAGSPIRLKCKYETQPVDTFAANGVVQSYNSDKVPLETLVEREIPKLDWQSRVRIGLEWERLVQAAFHDEVTEVTEIIDLFRNEYPLRLPENEEWDALDYATRKFLKFMQRRVTDSKKLFDAFNNPEDSLPVYEDDANPINTDINDKIMAIIEELFEKYQEQYEQPNPETSKAWRSGSLDYRFHLNQLKPDEYFTKYLFSWDKIPGNENVKLEGFLKKRFGADWVETAHIEKSDDDMTINLSSVDNYISLKLNKEKTKMSLEINDGRTVELNARTENSKLNIYLTNRKTSLIAPNYRNGDLDWHTFSTDGQVTEKWTEHDAIIRTPTRLSIGGTSLRWWAFENAKTDFGALDVAKPDLAKLALMEFALIYGDDWYSVPIPVKMGNLVKVDKLRVCNVFNEFEEITQARKVTGSQDKHWDLYSLCQFQDRDKVPDKSILFIPPVAGFREESEPLEAVHFLRDEGANMVWAIEHTILNGMGQPFDGFEAQAERIKRRNQVEIRELRSAIEGIRQQLETEALSDDVISGLEEEIRVKQARIEKLERGPFAQDKPINDAQLRYRMATKVPENWFPYIPVNVSRFFEAIPLMDGSPPLLPTIIRLQRAQMLRNVDDEEPTSISAFSRLLDDDTDPLLWIDENAIGRDGLRLMLTRQRVRWLNGKTFVWLGRKVLTGKGEGSSGLRFDVIQGGTK